jgi:phage shock protein C
MTDSTTKTCTACLKDIDSRALRCSFCTQRQGDVVGLYRDVPGRAAGGVTAAIAQHFNWDVTLMRVAFIVSLAVTGPIAVWVYLAVWAMTPFEQAGKAPLARLVEGLGKLFSPQRGVERVGPPLE